MCGIGRRIEVERTLTQDDFNRFATLSGDNNPIHVDAEFSAKARFGRTVAHGLLLNSILRGLLEALIPGGRQLSQELKFAAPTYADESLLFAVEIISEDENQAVVSMTLTRVADEVFTCQGKTTIDKGTG